jgi:hypothetical protein
MSAATARHAAGEPNVLASYESDEGVRRLVGQRVNGRVAVSDIPAGARGQVYLVERHLSSLAELDGLVADYLALASELGRAPMQRDWIFE